MIKKIFIRLLVMIKFFLMKIRFGSKFCFKNLKGIKLDTKFVIRQGGSIKLEELITFRNVYFSTVGGELSIGKGVFFNQNAIIACRDSIRIGDNCTFGPNIAIYDHDHAFGMDGIKLNEYKTDSIVIEDGCWIGAGSIILRGTHIGEGCVIGAGTVVSGNIPAHSVVTNSRELKITKMDR